MAITKSAKKAIRNSSRKAVFNLRRKRKTYDITKEIEHLLKTGKIEEAKQKLVLAYKAIDKSAKAHTIKKNTASRKKSRLAMKIAKATKSAK